MNSDELGKYIKLLRKKKGWTQKQLAEFSSLDRTTIGSIERGDYPDIGIRKIQRVLLLLGKRLILTDISLPTLDVLKG